RDEFLKICPYSLVVNGIEITFQVTVHHNPVSFLIILFRELDCLVGISAFTESETTLGKAWVYDWFDYLEDGLLYYPIQYTRNAQVAFRAIGFWYVNSFDWLGLICSLF